MSGETDDEDIATEYVGPSQESFSISPHERAVLRDVVRRVHFSKTAQRMATPTAEIDKFIDQMGAQVMENLLRAAQVARLPESLKRKVFSIPGTTPGGNLRRKHRIEQMVRRNLLRLDETLPGMKD